MWNKVPERCVACISPYEGLLKVVGQTEGFDQGGDANPITVGACVGHGDGESGYG